MKSSQKEASPLQIVAPLRRANRQYTQYIEDQLAVLGVPAIEGQILSYLKRNGSRPLADLARVFDVKRLTLNNLLDRMEDEGLVKREASSTNRGSLLIRTTVRGNRLATLARAVIEAFDETILERVSSDDVEGYKRVLAAIDETVAAQVRISPQKKPARASTSRAKRPQQKRRSKSGRNR